MIAWGRSVNILLNTSIQLALAGICTINLYNPLGKVIPFPYYQLLFVSTLGLYNFHRLVKLFSGQYQSAPDFQKQISDFRWLHMFLVIVCAGSALYLLFQLDSEMFIYLSIPALIAGSYAIPLIPSGKKLRALREIPGFKGFAVAITWTFLTAIIPYLTFGTKKLELSIFPIFLWLSQIISFYVITGLSDIRDLKTDPPHLKTLAQTMGVEKTIKLFRILLIVAILLATLACLRERINLNQLIGLSCGNLALIFLAQQSKPQQPGWFYTVLVDGVLLFQWSVFFLLDQVK